MQHQVKPILQSLQSQTTPPSSPILEVTGAGLVYNSTTPDVEPATQSAAKLRLSDKVHWMHALLQNKTLHEKVASGNLCKGDIVRLTNYELIRQSRHREKEKGGCSGREKRRCRSPVGNGFSLVKSAVGSGVDELPCLLIRELEVLPKERNDMAPLCPPEIVRTAATTQRTPGRDSSRTVSKVPSPSRFLSQRASESSPVVPAPKAWSERRMTFGELEGAAHGTRASFLAVLLCRRYPYDRISLEGTKQDWYLWDPTSPITATHPTRRRRKTILSVWRDKLLFYPAPGTIICLRNISVDKKWNDSVADTNWEEMLGDKHWAHRPGPPVKMVRVAPRAAHGHLNAFLTTPPDWFLLDARGVEGYARVAEWWESVGRKEWEIEMAADAEHKEVLDGELEERRVLKKVEKETWEAGRAGRRRALELEVEREKEKHKRRQQRAAEKVEDDSETERLLVEELERDENFGNG